MTICKMSDPEHRNGRRECRMSDPGCKMCRREFATAHLASLCKVAIFDEIFSVRFSSKRGVNGIDLDRNVLVFVQKWGEKYRFGRKSASVIWILHIFIQRSPVSIFLPISK